MRSVRYSSSTAADLPGRSQGGRSPGRRTPVLTNPNRSVPDCPRLCDEWDAGQGSNIITRGLTLDSSEDVGPYPGPMQQQYRFRVNVPFAKRGAVENGAGSGRAETQEHVFEMLRGVQREFRRQYVQLAGDHGLPFPVAGPCLALLQEISEHPGATVNEVARLTGLPKSRVSVLMSSLAAARIVRKDSDSRDSRLVRLFITPEGSRRTAEWSAAAQQAIGQLLQPLSDDELEVIAEGLAALQRAFELAEMPSPAEQHPTKGRPC
jgi:DNA-binding MarR family transcriptional regulator